LPGSFTQCIENRNIQKPDMCNLSGYEGSWGFHKKVKKRLSGSLFFCNIEFP